VYAHGLHQGLHPQAPHPLGHKQGGVGKTCHPCGHVCAESINAYAKVKLELNICTYPANPPNRVNHRRLSVTRQVSAVRSRLVGDFGNLIRCSGTLIVGGSRVPFLTPE